MLEIVNLGFARINSRRIVSLAEQSKESRIAAIVWDTCRDAALRSHPWGFAMRRERLARLEGKPPGKQLAYLPPADMLAARKVLA